MFKQTTPEEFVVEEITKDGLVLEVDKKYDFPSDSIEKNFHCVFVLQKKSWNTMQAIIEIARRLDVKPSRFTFAGTKDRNAITVQLVSCFALQKERLLPLTDVRDVSINGAWISKNGVRLGDLNGNRFTITFTKENCGKELSGENIFSKLKENDFLFPNFFGPQRFGSLRKNTHLVGLELLKNNFAGAVENFLTYAEGENDAEAVASRKRLAEEKDYAAALTYFPQHLKYERILIWHLARCKNDYAGAINRLPRNLQLMFIHAFQSFLFNLQLKEKIEKKKIAEGESIKLMGYESELTAADEALLAEYGLTKDSFKLKTLAYLSSKGGERVAFIKAKDFEVLEESPLKVRFSLPAGVYATVFIDYILES